MGNVARGSVVADLRLTGNGARPVLVGRATLQQMWVKLPFSRLTITEGELVLTEDKPFDPQIRVIGESIMDGRVVEVAVEGRALDPGVRLTSSPPLPEGEIAALLATGFPYDRRTNPDNNVHRVAHLIRRCQGIRRAGAAALDLAYVAAGWLDGYWEDRLKPWDLAAGALLVREAGGLASDFDLGPLSLQSGRCVASNGHFHEQLAAAVLSAPALLFSEPESTP
jgi:hypothetical protein